MKGRDKDWIAGLHLNADIYTRIQAWRVQSRLKWAHCQIPYIRGDKKQLMGDMLALLSRWIDDGGQSAITAWSTFTPTMDGT